MKIADLYVDLKLDSMGFNSELNRALSTATAKAKPISVPVTADTSKLDKSLRESEKGVGRLKGAFKGLGGAVAGGVAALGVGAFAKSVVSAASDAQQSIGATETVFGKFSDSVIKNSDKAAKSVGLSANAYRENANLVGSLLKNQGVAAKDLGKQTDGLIRVGADLSATFGGTTKEAVEALGSALKGEFDPLEKYGISLKASTVSTEAMRIAGVKSKGAFEKLSVAQQTAAKRQATTNIIMKQSADAQGAFGRETDTLAHQQQVLGAQFENVKSKIGRALLPILTRLLMWVNEKMLPAFKTLQTLFVTKVVPAFKALGEMIREKVMPPLTKFIRFLIDNKESVIAFVGVLAGFLIINKIVGMVKALAGAVRILSAAMAANPIGLVVVALAALAAGLVFAYKHSETFKRIVDDAWKKIQVAVKIAWEQYIKPALTALWAFITQTLIPTVQRLWRDYIQPAFVKIGQIISFAWNNVIKPILSAWWTYITKVLIPVIKFLWNNVIKPAFSFIGKVISVAWNNVIKPIFKAFWAYISNVLIPVIKFLWQKIIQPGFSLIGTIIKNTWEKFIKPTFEKLKEGVDKIRGAFKTAVDKIGTIWEGLKSAAKTPVKFIIDTVYNNGIWKIVDLLPGDNPLKKFDTSGWKSGGVLPGFTPGRDVHQFYSPTAGGLALSGGEAIMRPEWVRAVGGPAAVATMNKRARRGIYDHFYSGGIWRPTKSGSYMGGIHGSPPAVDVGVGVGTPVYAGHAGRVSSSYDIRGYEPRAPHGGLGYRSYGRVINISGDGISTLYAHLSERYAKVGTQLTGGELIGLSGNTGHSFGPHLHFGASGISPRYFGSGATSYSGGGGDGGSNWFSIIGDVKDAFGNVKDAVSNMANSDWFGVMKTAAKGIVNMAVDFINDKIPNWGPVPDNPLPHFDNGGWLERGRTLAVNNTGGPEAVLTGQQWQQMERLIRAVETGRGGGAPLIGHAVIRENVDLELYERQRAFRDRMTRVGG